MKAFAKVCNLLNSGRGRQFAGLLSANVLGVPISFVSNIIITSYLGAALYGDFQFIYTIFNTANILLNFGFFYAGNRAIVLSKSKEQTCEYYGAMLIIIVSISILMAAAVGIYSIVDGNVAEKGLTKYLIAILPFSGIFMLNQCFEAMLQADNQIRLLSYTRLLPKILLLSGGIFALFLIKDRVENKLTIILVAYIFALLSVYTYVYLSLRPSFNNIKQRLCELFTFETSYGFNVYLGAIFAVGFAQLSDILISYFNPDNTNLGYYKLAVQFCTPLSFVPMTLANTHFKDFSVSSRIQPKLVKLTFILSGAVLVLLWAVVPVVIKLFFKPEFSQVIYICMVTSVGVVLYGFADFFNRYLAARGQGKLLRNISFIIGPLVLIFGILLIPRYGAFGAAIAKVCSGISYFSLMLFAYMSKTRHS